MTTETIWGDRLSDWMTLKAAFRDGYFPMYSSIRSIYVAIDRGIYRGLLERRHPLTGHASRELWVHLPSLVELHEARGYSPPGAGK